MSQYLIDKAMRVLLSEARNATVVDGQIVIRIEGPENYRLFAEALKVLEVQAAFDRRKAKPILKQIDHPIEQAKNYILKVLKEAGEDTEHIVYPCLGCDAEAYHKALALPEVIREFQRRDVKASIDPQSTPMRQETSKSIYIATIDDVASGKLDDYFKNH